MKRFSGRDAFLIATVLVLAAAALAGVYAASFLSREEYAPIEAAAPPPEQTKQSEKEKRILSSKDTVYISEKGKAYHKSADCAGDPENVQAVTCAEAVEMGKKPCRNCLKGYTITDG